tara:strand:- start:261 stop:761 length:501 start_codon:yes stop_codon:yes gene_type:complete
MKEFTKQEIDKWREEFKVREYTEKIASLDNRNVDYFIMPNELFEGIPNGLFRMTGKPSDGYVVGVSDEVPKVIQPHFAMTEHDEFMVYGLKDLDSTLHSEQHMLNLLKDEKDLRPLYAENKLTLYNHMIKNAKGDLEGWGFTQNDFDGFVRAAEYLNQELKSGDSK